MWSMFFSTIWRKIFGAPPFCQNFNTIWRIFLEGPQISSQNLWASRRAPSEKKHSESVLSGRNRSVATILMSWNGLHFLDPSTRSPSCIRLLHCSNSWKFWLSKITISNNWAPESKIGLHSHFWMCFECPNPGGILDRANIETATHPQTLPRAFTKKNHKSMVYIHNFVTPCAGLWFGKERNLS